MNQYYVYIMGNARPTLYIGVTGDLVRRVYEHRSGDVPGFSQKYKLKKLLWFECHSDINEAIKREKQIKEWKRNWKLGLILSDNPDLADLYTEIA